MEQEIMKATKAIRAKCIDCCGGGMLEVRTCSTTNCPLWLWRMGLNPNTSKNKKNPLLQKEIFEKNTNLDTESMSVLLKKYVCEKEKNGNSRKQR